MSHDDTKLIQGVKDRLYRWHQDAFTARVKRRSLEDFDAVEYFCLFIGYPRSGHSIVGALLNAHRHVVISHELVIPPLVINGCSRDELYARILARAWWFNMRGNRANYDYRVPGQSQGRFEELRIIGDKRGGAVSRALIDHPDFLERVRSLTGVPLRLVHVVRNPFDNIGAISIEGNIGLEEATDYYFDHVGVTSRLDQFCGPEELLEVKHEDMIADPEGVLTRLCSHLGLELYDGYLEDCCRVVFRKPSHTRRRVQWPARLVDDIEKRMSAHPFLSGYTFSIRSRD